MNFMKRLFGKMMLAFGIVMIVCSGAFISLAATESNTLNVTFGDKDYIFYLYKAEVSDYEGVITYYSYSEQKEPEYRISIQKKKRKWDAIVFDGRYPGNTGKWNDMYMGIVNSGFNLNVTCDDSDNGIYSGTLSGVVYFSKEQGPKLKNGTFNFEVGERHRNVGDEFEWIDTTSSSQSKNTTNTQLSKSKQTKKSSSSDEYCPYCDGIGDCDACLGIGWCEKCLGDHVVYCNTCSGTGDCQSCYGQGGEYYYTVSGGNKWIKCSSCNGRKTCRTCGGNREVKCSSCNGSGDCRKCGGSGKCQYCGGTGEK